MKTLPQTLLAHWATGTLLLTMSVVGSHAQSYSVDWYKIGGGGGASIGGMYEISGTIGQSDASVVLSGGNYSLIGGFWSIIGVVQTAGLPDLLIAHTGNSVIISWPNTGSYRLLQSPNLTEGSWMTSCYRIATLNGTNSITINSPTGNLFFRLDNP